MEKPINTSPNPVATNVAVSVGPAAVGAAVGLLVAEALDQKGRRTAAAGLLAVGALSALPMVVSLIANKINHPGNRRGNERALAAIREGAGVFDEEGFESFDS